MPKTTNWNTPNIRTLPICGSDRASVAMTICMPRRRLTIRSGRNARRILKLRTIVRLELLSTSESTDVTTISPSRQFHASLKYAPGCNTSPIDMIFVHISMKKTVVNERSKPRSTSSVLEPGFTEGSSTMSAMLEAKMSSSTTYSNFLSNAIMNTTRRNGLCGENAKRLRCFMYTGGASPPVRMLSSPTFFCACFGRSLSLAGRLTMTSRSGTPSVRRFPSAAPPRTTTPMWGKQRSSGMDSSSTSLLVMGWNFAISRRRASMRCIISLASSCVLTRVAASETPIERPAPTEDVLDGGFFDGVACVLVVFCSPSRRGSRFSGGTLAKRVLPPALAGRRSAMPARFSFDPIKPAPADINCANARPLVCSGVKPSRRCRLAKPLCRAACILAINEGSPSLSPSPSPS
mmetsp:Transcript_10843/g.48894  ORF Transcript_10843/g.48894 Transcript_10843/m.48894 type:complete len:405 (+) Transcript_10843:1455-2669(+)